MTDDEDLDFEAASAPAEPPNPEFEKSLRALGSHALAKSVVDYFDYALRLRTGEVIRYAEAEILGPDWIHLSEARICDGFLDEMPHFPRGIDVRLSDIVWVKDAPFGS